MAFSNFLILLWVHHNVVHASENEAKTQQNLIDNLMDLTWCHGAINKGLIFHFSFMNYDEIWPTILNTTEWCILVRFSSVGDELFVENLKIDF